MKFDDLVNSILNEASYHQDAIDAEPSHDAVLKDLMDSYITNTHVLDQGYGEDAARAEREQPIITKKLLKLKGQEFVDILEDLATAITHRDEYAGPSESGKLNSEIDRLTKELKNKFGVVYDI